ANLVSIKVARQLRRALGSQRLPDSDEIAVEREMIKAETRSLLDRTLELGDGDPAIGQLRAVERGVIDVPFSSWIKVNGRVMIVRDRTGAVRYLDTGNLPFSREIVDYHRAKIAERERAEGRPADLKMVIDDVRGYAAELFRAPEVVVAGR
ncbi:MAG: hypothetical protein HY329_21070, partial [Chloroflexi bacterium]|nr:hypothetical protein [Chloroflexota bacterium]